jgi:hypothetical protein
VSAAVLVYERYMQYVNHPEEVVASSGMYAAGDWMLELFIGCMLLVPTFLLALVIRNSEYLFARYSKALLGLSLTAPVCMGVFSIPAVNQGTMVLGYICVDRLFGSPLVLLGLGFSRFLARFDRSKRLISYALVIEFLTLVLMSAENRLRRNQCAEAAAGAKSLSL